MKPNSLKETLANLSCRVRENNGVTGSRDCFQLQVQGARTKKLVELLVFPLLRGWVMI